MKKQKGFIGLPIVSGLGGLFIVAFTAGVGMLADGTIKPVSGHDLNCQIQTVKSDNGNYSYASTDHCVKK